MAAVPDKGLLVAYWIRPRNAALGQCFGVSAYSLEDAQRLLTDAGIAVDLGDPDVRVQEGITFSDLDPGHIAPNIGPMQFRGVWYPRMNLK